MLIVFILDLVLNLCNFILFDYYINFFDGCIDFIGKSKVNIGKCDNSFCIWVDVVFK